MFANIRRAFSKAALSHKACRSGRHFQMGLALLFVSLFTTSVFAGGKNRMVTLEFTVTNVMRGAVLTPPILANTLSPVSIFDLGQPASSALEQLAEGGDTGPLAEAFGGITGAQIHQHDAPITPLGSISFQMTVPARSYVTFGSMLLPTNDAFAGRNSIPVYQLIRSSVPVFAYDAGTEINDEVCANIPGPLACGGGVGYVAGGGEGLVYGHTGIHGEAEILASTYDWRGPVATISATVVSFQ